MNIDQAEKVHTIVVGAGQAGLAVGYHLARVGQDLLILDAGERVGNAWRDRWDGLRLFSPARYDGLPGMPFPGPGHSHPTKDEVADYLEAYATRMGLPIRLGTSVSEIRPAHDGDGFLLVAGDHRFHAVNVVVATGAYIHPRIPDFAAELHPGIRQLHSSRYRNPSQLVDGAVLVVGASNSGAEIALGLAGSHRTVLSGPDKGRMPVRPEGRVARVTDPVFWFFLNHIATLGTPIGRKALPNVRDHGGPLERIWPADLAAAGVERVLARTVGVQDGLPMLDDGRVVDATNVVWCTGFRPDFAWIHLPVFGDDGWPLHVRGVIPTALGLFFVGLPFMYSAASALLGGVGRDAAYVAEHLTRRSAATAASPDASVESRSGRARRRTLSPPPVWTDRAS
jgi:putative flavoprotein involved in K+ transport